MRVYACIFMYLIYNICCWKRVSISMFCPNKQYNTNVILAIRMARLCTYSLLMWGAIEYIYIYVHMDIHTALAQYNTLWSHHVYILVYLCILYVLSIYIYTYIRACVRVCVCMCVFDLSWNSCARSVIRLPSALPASKSCQGFMERWGQFGLTR